MECWICLEGGADRVLTGLDEECEKMELLTEMGKAIRGPSLGRQGFSFDIHGLRYPFNI